MKYLNLLFLISLSSLTAADIYQCDDNGTTSFQSKPCSKEQTFQKKIEVK